MKWLLLTASGVGAFAGLGLVMVFMLQRHLIYFPDPSAPRLSSADEAMGLQDVVLTAADGVELQGWHRPPPEGGSTVLIFHGNAGHRGDRLDLIRHLVGLELGILALDYRGYGGSTGSPTEAGLYADAEAAVGWLERRGLTKLIYFGESLGTGVAVELALRRPPGKLILQAPFESLTAVGARAYPFLPVAWILKDRFASIEKIGRVEAPLLVLHGEEDDIVPIDHGRRLFERGTEPKRFVAIDGAGHNDLRQTGRAYFDPLDAFLLE